MRKIVLTYSCIFCLFTMGHTQDITVGGRLGNSISTLRGEYGYSRENTHTDYSIVDALHITYGVFVNYGMVKNLLAQLEVNYRTKRMFFANKSGLIGGSWRGSANFNYLALPLLAKYTFGNRFRGFVNAGPVLNVLVSGGDYKYHVWGSQAGGVTYDYNRNIKSDFNPVTIGVLGGLGVEWNIFSNFVLLGEARVTYDLSNAAKRNSYTDPNTATQWYYSTTRFFLYSIDIGIAYKIGSIAQKARDNR